MFGPDVYLYLYAAAIRAGLPDPAAVARKGAEDYDNYRDEREAAHQAKRAEESAARKPRGLFND